MVEQFGASMITAIRIHHMKSFIRAKKFKYQTLESSNRGCDPHFSNSCKHRSAWTFLR